MSVDIKHGDTYSARAETLLGGSEDSATGDEGKCVLHCDGCVDARCFGVGYQIVIVCEERLDDEVGEWRMERLWMRGWMRRCRRDARKK